MYIYKSHKGDLYASNQTIKQEELYCAECGVSDVLIGEAYSREEAWKLLHPLTNINGSGGFDYKDIKKFLDEKFR